MGTETEGQEKATAVFRVYDIDGKNWLERSEMMSAFAELGVLHGLNAKTLGEVIGMDKSLQARDKRFTLQEFLQAHDKLQRYFSNSRAARKALPDDDDVTMSSGDEAALSQCFNNYCRYTVGQGRLTVQQEAGDLKMNSAQFSKLATDLGVVEPHGPLPQAEVDIIFAKCKSPGTRRLTFPQFVRSVGTLAKDFSVNTAEVMQALGPQLKPRTSLVGPTPAPFLRKYKGKEWTMSTNQRQSDTGASLSGALDKHDNLLAMSPTSTVPRELQGIDDYLAAARNPRMSTTGLSKLSPLVLERLQAAEARVETLEGRGGTMASLANHKVLEERLKDLDHKMQSLDPHGVANGGSVEARFLADEGRLAEQEEKLAGLLAKVEALRVQAMAPGSGKGGGGSGCSGNCAFGPNEASMLASADAKVAAVQIQVSAAEDTARQADQRVGQFQTQIRNLDQNVEKAEWKFQDVLQMLKTLHQMIKDVVADKDKALVEAMQVTDAALAKMQSDVKEAMASSAAAAVAIAESKESMHKVGDMEVVLGDLHKQQAELYINVSNLQIASNKAAVDGEGLNGRLNEALEQIALFSQAAATRDEKNKAESDTLVAVEERVKALANQIVDVQRESKEVASSIERVQTVAAAAPAEGLRVLEGKVAEIVAKTAAVDGAALDDMRVQVRVLASELAVVKARPTVASAAGGGGGSGGATASELEAFKEQMYEDMRDLDSTIGRIDQSVKVFGTVVERLKTQVENSNRDLDLKLTSYSKITDLRESENHLLDRHAQLHDEIEAAKRNVREMSKGVEENTEKVMVQFNKLATQYSGQATIFAQLQVQVAQVDQAVAKVDERIEGRAQSLETGVGRHLQSSNTAIEDAMKALEARLLAADGKVQDLMRLSETRLLDSDTQIRMALGTMDQHVAERFEMGDKVLMRLARQIDYLQKKLREVAEDGGGPTTKTRVKHPLPPGASAVESSLSYARGAAGRQAPTVTPGGEHPGEAGTILPREPPSPIAPAGEGPDAPPRRHRRHQHRSRDEDVAGAAGTEAAPPAVVTPTPPAAPPMAAAPAAAPMPVIINVN